MNTPAILPSVLAPDAQGIYSLTPQNIVSPLPDIAASANYPYTATPPSSGGSTWCDLNSLIAQNPIIAGMVLLGVTAMLWRKK